MPRIFISYSHKDETWLDALMKFLRGVKLIENDLWSDQRIELGQDWHREIKNNIQRADAAILLISQDFVDSKFIDADELAPLLARHAEGTVRIFPLHVRWSTLQSEQSSEPLSRIQSYPRDRKPLDGRARAARERELASFANHIRDILVPREQEPVADEYYTRREERAAAPAWALKLSREAVIRVPPIVNPGEAHERFRGAADLSRMLERPGPADRFPSAGFGPGKL